MQVVILCGGKGLRFEEQTPHAPKVLARIGPEPILMHIMRMYSAAGFVDFVLCLGHLKEAVCAYFRAVGAPSVQQVGADGERFDLDGGDSGTWQVLCLDTGADTPTGARLLRAAPFMRDESFFVTYGDGLANVDLRELLMFHEGHGRTGTITVVHPRSPFGMVQLEGSAVTSFKEKPVLNQWISSGFFVFRRSLFVYLGPESDLEAETLAELAAGDQLMAYRHRGFWACMDTYKDKVLLDALWCSGRAPWRTTS